MLQGWVRSALTLAGYVGKEHSCHSMRAGGAESLVAAGFRSWAVGPATHFVVHLKMTDGVRKEASSATGELKKQDVEVLVRRGPNKVVRSRQGST